MKEIELFGEKLSIAFNMAVEIAYEDITGKAFNVDDLNRVKNTISLYYAAIIVNNPDTNVQPDDLLKKATANDILTLRTAVFEAFEEWCKQPEVGAEKKGPADPNP